MAVLRSLMPYGASYGRWVLLSLPLFFAIGHRFDEAVKLGCNPVFAPPLTGLAIITLVAMSMAVYIARLRTGRATLTRRLQEADELQRVSTRVTSSDTLQSAVGCVLDALRQQYPFTAAVLVPAGAGSGCTAWRVTGGPTAAVLPEPFDRSVEAREIASSADDGLSYAELDAAYPDFRALLPGCRCSAAVPVTLPDNTRTSTLVLGFESEHHLTVGDLHWLNAFARGLALPLERVRIQEELAHLAYTDPMTGLANYRAFRRHLHDEINRAARYGHALSLLILDVDKFKRVNDQYGHPAGDEVLRHAARVVQKHLRSIDLPARYGGEEFAVVCPETEVGAALVLAERLRAALENAVCTLPCGETLRVTMSIGVSVFPNEAITELDFVATADAALYRAKEEGRNRVSCALNIDIDDCRSEDTGAVGAERELACA